MPKPRAILSADGKSFTLKIRGWKNTFPLKKIDGQIALYRRLVNRSNPRTGKPRAYAQHYQPTLDALTGLKKRISDEEKTNA